jgi:broad specificity phosphatase PhoE
VPIVAIYSSPLERAIETATVVAESHGLSVQALQEIGEMRFGSWEGREFQELTAQDGWNNFNTFRIGTSAPNGELILETQARMVRAVTRIRQEHPTGIVTLISHLDPLRALICTYLGIPLDLMQRIEMAPASISVLRLNESSAHVACISVGEEIPL